MKRTLISIVILCNFLLPPLRGIAQKIDTVSQFSITGYIDAYYAYYTDSVGPGKYQKFPTVSPRSNSPSLNTAQLALAYNADKLRAMAVLHFGDIANATWPHPYNNIMEAHIGLKVYSKLWIDAGFFRTHFGTEFLLPSENLTSSIAVPTFFEPYYESGIRFNFDPTKKLEINLFLLNGYNVFVDNNNKKSFGMGITYALSDNTGIGYTNYIGDDTPPLADSIAHLRIHNNLFLNKSAKKFKLQVGADYCIQQNSDAATGTKSASMFSFLATLKYLWTNKFAVYGRGETFSDPDGYMSVLIADKTGKMTGYKVSGATLGCEFKPTDESYVRLEGRYLQMNKDQEIFYTNGTATSNRFEVMINAGITFDLLRNVRTR